MLACLLDYWGEEMHLWVTDVWTSSAVTWAWLQMIKHSLVILNVILKVFHTYTPLTTPHHHQIWVDQLRKNYQFGAKSVNLPLQKEKEIVPWIWKINNSQPLSSVSIQCNKEVRKEDSNSPLHFSSILLWICNIEYKFH